MPGPRFLMASFSSLLNEYALSPVFRCSAAAAAVTGAKVAILIKSRRLHCMRLLKVQLQRHLDLARLILLRGSDAAKGCGARIGVRRGKTHVVKSVERLETVLQPEALAHLEVLEYSTVEVVDAAGAHNGPAGGICA